MPPECCPPSFRNPVRHGPVRADLRKIAVEGPFRCLARKYFLANLHRNSSSPGLPCDFRGDRATSIHIKRSTRGTSRRKPSRITSAFKQLPTFPTHGPGSHFHRFWRLLSATDVQGRSKNPRKISLLKVALHSHYSMKIGWNRRIGRPSSTLWQLSRTSSVRPSNGLVALTDQAGKWCVASKLSLLNYAEQTRWTTTHYWVASSVTRRSQRGCRALMKRSIRPRLVDRFRPEADIASYKMMEQILLDAASLLVADLHWESGADPPLDAGGHKIDV
jgi:hypothetical protein